MGLAGLGAFAGQMLNKGVDFASARYFQRSEQSFEKEMSNTAYQRATADMRKAGLNPLLAYQQGGASTPTGGGGMPLQSGATDAPISSAQNAKRLNAEMESIRSQVDLNKALKKQALEQANLNSSSAKQVRVHTNNASKRTAGEQNKEAFHKTLQNPYAMYKKLENRIHNFWVNKYLNKK